VRIATLGAVTGGVSCGSTGGVVATLRAEETVGLSTATAKILAERETKNLKYVKAKSIIAPVLKRTRRNLPSTPNCDDGHEEGLLDVPTMEPTDGVYYPHVTPELLPTPFMRIPRSLSTDDFNGGSVPSDVEETYQRVACPLAAPGFCP